MKTLMNNKEINSIEQADSEDTDSENESSSDDE